MKAFHEAYRASEKPAPLMREIAWIERRILLLVFPRQDKTFLSFGGYAYINSGVKTGIRMEGTSS